MNKKTDHSKLAQALIEKLDTRDALIRELKSLKREKDLIEIIKLKYEQ